MDRARGHRARGTRADGLGCDDVCELLTDYLEQALPDGPRRAVAWHLDGCTGCSAWLAQVLATVAALGCLREGTISPPVLAALQESFATS
ncbi:zf-HC2 domain-containing protein [Nonomuraea sp. NPDC050643]|uniref:zf-HC2 domain-containing protein n=1 Tax=Nonomuraea sp. NPDC050643 TaxID=3155660 RepID=UPI0033F26A9B